ncbi:MAG: TrkA family potassium uptake protein [Lachnospiraceae bacterium]|jgi:trk system potassium uptake protein TrkA|nr:TrkA family potassium uptake protein [Lachnospiraceae bacterium]
MMRKSFVVFGLGEFGQSVALTMAKNGYDVLAVDKRTDRVQEIADHVTRAIRADATDMEVMKSLGVDTMDGAIVGIGGSLEASILITIAAKECGVPYVLAKARESIEEKVLRRVGADEVVFPERAMGIRIGQNLSSGNFTDIIELSSKFSMVEMKIPSEWENKTLRELNLRKLGLNIIARKYGDEVTITLNPDAVMDADAICILVGSNESLEKIKEK